jgi:hypothetical protein
MSKHVPMYNTGVRCGSVALGPVAALACGVAREGDRMHGSALQLQRQVARGLCSAVSSAWLVHCTLNGIIMGAT